MAHCHIAEQSALGMMMNSKLQGSSILRKAEQLTVISKLK